MADDNERLLRIAEAIADETPVLWDADADATPEERLRLEKLKALEAVASAYRSLHASAPAGEDSSPSGGRHDAAREAALFAWGHLRVLEKLGDGSFGEVFRAYDPLLDLEVALKLRRAEDAAPAAARRHFIQEARRLARVRHPNVVTVHGADVHDGRVGMWTDLVTGHTLEEWIGQEGPLSAEEAALIGLDLCRALAAVHKAGLVHGDVKTTNVMRERGGRIVLMDFGAGREIAVGGGRAGAAGTLGTPIVMAPEVLHGQTPSPGSDIYSLGVLLYRLVSGRYPVEAATLQELQERHGRGAVSPLRDTRPDLPAEIAAVIGRAMAPAPGGRYASAGAMEHALLGWLAAGRGADSSSGQVARGRRGGAARNPLIRWFAARPRWQVAVGTAALAVAAGAVGVVLLLGVPRARGRTQLEAPQVRSLAVLPFQALDREGRNDYLGLGVADALINRLSRLPGIVVRPSSAVLRYAEARPELEEVGRSLGVEALLDGRIQRSGDRVRVTAQLVSTVGGAPIWSATLDRKAADIFELEDSLSEQLARALRIRLTETQRATLAWRPTANPDAYQAYLKARYFWNKWTPASVGKSVELLEEATGSDPAFALAYSGLSDSFTVLAGLESAPVAPAEAYERAQTAALQALELDANLADAHAALGAVRSHRDWDWTAAESEFSKAIELNANCFTAHLWYAELLSVTGRHEEAVAEIGRALQTDPLSLAANAMAGSIYLEAGRADDARQQLARALEIEPAFHLSYTFLASAYERQGNDEETVSNWQNAMVLAGEPEEDAAALGRAFRGGGISAAWRWRLDRLREDARKRYVPPALLARAHAALGETRQALALVARAATEHDEFLLKVAREPAFDRLRSDARFVAAMRSTGLPEGASASVFRREPAAQASPAAAPPRVEVALYRTRSGEPEPIDTGGSVRPGDQLSLTVESPEPVHLYVLNGDRVGNVFVLFPIPGLDTSNPLPGNQRSVLPGGRDGVVQNWLVTSAGGEETILVVAARERLPQVEREFSRIEVANPNRPVERLALAPSPGGAARGVGGLTPIAPAPPAGVNRLAAIQAALASERGVWVRRFLLQDSGL
ncbi:MAG TPA: protein kinase [Thermoanaerobaculaceae bacterium]|nr:protein kinase [Thermoanaerobaculaceae bacterium]